MPRRLRETMGSGNENGAGSLVRGSHLAPFFSPHTIKKTKQKITSLSLQAYRTPHLQVTVMVQIPLTIYWVRFPQQTIYIANWCPVTT